MKVAKKALKNAKKVVQKLPIDAVFITDPANVRYLSTYTGSSGQIFLTPNKSYFITDARYRNIGKSIQKKTVLEYLEIKKRSLDFLPEICKKHRIKNLGFEDEKITYAQYRDLKKIVQKVHLKPIEKTISSLRRQKFSDEIRLIRKSQKLNEQVLSTIFRTLKLGESEVEIAADIKKIARDYGAEDVSFNPIVAFGGHSATPHHQNTTRKLEKGDIVLIDMGVIYKGYCSDMTRVFFTKKPTSEQEKIYNIVLQAQERAIKNIREGTLCKTIDDLIHDTFIQKRLNKFFTHSAGHGLGLEIHEGISFNAESKDTLLENEIVTVEPGLYIAKKFGIRIEDMILVKEKTYQNFTHYPKNIKNLILSLT